MLKRTLRALKNPRKLLRKATRALYFPLWSRQLLGAVLPPYSGYSKFRSVYVVTYGRSGSTLLTGYLTELPGFDLKGENYLFPLPAMESEKKVRDSRRKPYKGRENPENPWYGSHQFSPHRWRADITRAMLNQLYPSRPIPKTIGFKEIRWYSYVKPEEFDETLEWLCSLRGPGAVIFLFRDLDKVMSSAWWAELPPEKAASDRKKLERFEAQAREFAHTHPNMATVITYEEFIKDPAAPQRVCDLLGVKYSEATWKKVLSGNYSYKGQKDDPEAQKRKSK
jgi:hypothetical protein